MKGLISGLTALQLLSRKVQLGFLIDRQPRQVHVYRPGQAPEILENPDGVSGDPELPGFQLQMAKIW